ncbi:MarR family transcriptional regulator [Cetobacterium sp.]|uniref:MarR family transcriptional regulator n=1 Tax=Cetobacterium sp. TaxID=2071632 RepID=UPI003F3E38C8
MKRKIEILKIINETPGITLSKLCEYLVLTKGNISLHLKEMEKENLIKKYKTKNDKKVFKLHPTRKGKDLYLNTKLKEIKNSSS